MSFYEQLGDYANFSFADFFAQVSEEQVLRSLEKEQLQPLDFLILLSPKAAQYLERMAQRAHQLTVRHFGRTIQLFIPLYLSNHCANQCAYCGFHRGNQIIRRKLSLEEIEQEAQAIARTGMQHILFLTGEAQHLTPLSYLEAAARCLKRYFASVAIEVYPLEVEQYRRLLAAGVDGMTLFQECYDQTMYAQVHLAGKKMDYRFRLDAPERAAKAGLRAVNIGPLLGLAEPRREMFFTGLHARYLEKKFLDTEVAVSLPRFNHCESDFQPAYQVDDKSFVQFMTAFRLFLPRAGITISTRENAAFRDRLLPLGATRYSAGSCTGVGGYAHSDTAQSPQFDITDTRSVEEVAQAISARGYQPVYKDWDDI